MFDVEKIKKDFPILQREVGGQSLVYLDSAATSQKPQQVVDAIADYYLQHNANIHRGIHMLGDESTRMYAQARKKVAAFLGSSDENCLIFVRNATEGINLVARTWGVEEVDAGDVIVTSEMEHHANMVPWQELAKAKRARVEYVRVNDAGEIDVENLDEKLAMKPKLVAITQVSNFLGTVNPISEIVEKSHQVGAKVLVDGAQAVPHIKVEVEKLGVDFYAFSGHKILGPMGIGGLWVRKNIVEKMSPFLYGGGMIDEVSLKSASWADLPDRFDAGTPNVAGAVGLAVAVDYLNKIGMGQVHEHEKKLIAYAMDEMQKLGYIKVVGSQNSERRAGVISFVVEGVHAHDVAQILDRKMGVAVRSGHHCVMPMHEKLKLAATTRASFYVYNTMNDVDKLIEGLKLVKSMLG